MSISSSSSSSTQTIHTLDFLMQFMETLWTVNLLQRLSTTTQTAVWLCSSGTIAFTAYCVRDVEDPLQQSVFILSSELLLSWSIVWRMNNALQRADED